MLKTLKDSIKFESESKEQPDMNRRKKPIKKDDTPQKLDESVREVVGKKFLEDHYRKWVDMPILSLRGRTPREASKTQEGRAKLKGVVNVIGNAEERKKKAGKPSYDVSRLCKVLGM